MSPTATKCETEPATSVPRTLCTGDVLPPLCPSTHLRCVRHGIAALARPLGCKASDRGAPGPASSQTGRQETTMATTRFDQITSSLAQKQTRRGALRLLATAALGAGGLTALGHDAGQAKNKKKGKRKKKTTVTPYTRANGQSCATRNDCASVLCPNGTCQTCAIDADCGSDAFGGCFCDQPAAGGPTVCSSNRVPSGGAGVSSCAICPTGTTCVGNTGTPGTFNCYERCGAP